MNKYLIYFGLVLIFISCNPPQSTEKETGGVVSRTFSNSYNAPDFVNDNRTEKIKEIAPAIQQLIEEHGKTKKIPSIAYGIVVDNELVVASATGFINLENKLPATTKSCFRIASMTKSFTAMAIMKLRAREP